MAHTHEEITQTLAERWCWEVARRDDSRVARRLDRTPRVDGVDRLDAGARRDDCLHCLQAIGVMARWEDAPGAAIHRERRRFGQDGPALRGADPGWAGAQPCPAPLAVQ
jgi:hypothetical protein